MAVTLKEKLAVSHPAKNPPRNHTRLETTTTLNQQNIHRTFALAVPLRVLNIVATTLPLIVIVVWPCCILVCCSVSSMHDHDVIIVIVIVIVISPT